MRGPIFATLLVGLISGCAHQQLQFNTTHQADTLNDIYRRQVLDNLAMFADNPHAVPHFAFPNEGSSNVTDSGKLAGGFYRFWETLGFDANRSMQEAWVLDPVRDPDKLKRMRCAYQRAVGVCSGPCNDCCKLEKEFYGSGDKKIRVLKKESETSSYETATKEACMKACCKAKQGCKTDGEEAATACCSDCDENEKACCEACKAWVVVTKPDGCRVSDPLTGLPFVEGDGDCVTPCWNPRTSKPYEIDAEGCVTIPAYDCNGPCTIPCGWFGVGRKKDVPRDCRHYSGHYHHTYVWVLPQYRHHLSNLILTVLDYAIKDAPETRNKEVVLYVNQAGDTTTKAEAHAKVTGVIPIGEPNASILVVGNCEKKGTATKKETERIEATLGWQSGQKKLILAKQEALKAELKSLLLKLSMLEEAEKDRLADLSDRNGDAKEKAQLTIQLRQIKSELLRTRLRKIDIKPELAALNIRIKAIENDSRNLSGNKIRLSNEIQKSRILPPSSSPARRTDRFGSSILQDRLRLNALAPR